MKKELTSYIIDRKGIVIKDEMIYGEGLFHRIKIVNYKNDLYWINKHNGIIKECVKIGRI